MCILAFGWLNGLSSSQVSSRELQFLDQYQYQAVSLTVDASQTRWCNGPCRLFFLAYLLSFPPVSVDRMTILSRREIPPITKGRRYPDIKVSIIHHKTFPEDLESPLNPFRPLEAAMWVLSIS